MHKKLEGKVSYHDLHVTTMQIERKALSDLPFGFEVICNRVTGWQLWFHAKDDGGELLSVLLAQEYGLPGKGLRLDVNGVVICDSITLQ